MPSPPQKKYSIMPRTPNRNTHQIAYTILTDCSQAAHMASERNAKISVGYFAEAHLRIIPPG